MDLKESRGAGAQDQGVTEFPAILERIWTSPTPVLARLAGPARAGGVGLVAACDIAVAAAEDATFAFSEVRIGVVPAVISVAVLPRLLPRAAHELFLTGETFDAERGGPDRADQQRGARRSTWTPRWPATPTCCAVAPRAPGRDQGAAATGAARGAGRPVRRDAAAVGRLLRRPRRPRRAWPRSPRSARPPGRHRPGPDRRDGPRRRASRRYRRLAWSGAAGVRARRRGAGRAAAGRAHRGRAVHRLRHPRLPRARRRRAAPR